MTSATGAIRATAPRRPTRSKTLAERAAWRFVEKQATQIQLTAINPGFVLGPALGGGVGTSAAVLQRILAAKDPALPNVGFPVADICDVARMHVAALQTPAAIGKRIIGTDAFLTFRDMALALREAFPTRRIVTRQAPDLLIRMLGQFDRSIGTIASELCRRIAISSEQPRTIFGMEFRPARGAVVESANSLLGRGLVR